MLAIARSSRFYLPVLAAFSLFAGRGTAQIVPDATLPQNSIVNLNGSIFDITGGTQMEANLFHSFQEFSVPAGMEAFFDRAAGIENIFARVTGGSISNIDGTLGASGSASLFFLNPSGIVFGPNARLDLNGSFFASTAASINFEDGTTFSAVAPQPLLTVSVPVGLQYGENPEAIAANGATLEVTDDSALLLLGGEVALQDSTLRAPGGEVVLFGIGSAGTIALQEEGFVAPSETPRADVTVSNGFIEVEAENMGRIGIDGQNVTVSGDSTFEAGLSVEEGSADSQAGDIELTAAATLTVDGSTFSSVVAETASGNAGNIELSGQAIALDNVTLIADNFSGGQPGTIVLQADGPISVTGSELGGESSSPLPDAGGEISIASAGGSVLLDGTTVATDNNDLGDAGNIVISAPEEVAIVNQSNISSGGRFGTILIGATEADETTGDGGIEPENAPAPRTLRVEDSILRTDNENNTVAGEVPIGGIVLQARETIALSRSNLSATSVRDGNAGEVSIAVTGGNISLLDSEVLSDAGNGVGNAGNIGVSAPGGEIAISGGMLASELLAGGTGVAGDLNLTAGTISVTDGALLTTNTFGAGNAGGISLIASDRIDLQSSVIVSDVAMGAIGNGGDIDIAAANVALANGTIVGTNAFGGGNAGDVAIAVGESNAPAIESVSIDNAILASNLGEGVAGMAGAVAIRANQIALTNGAELSTNTFGTGDAGTVSLEATNALDILGEGTIVTSDVEPGAIGSGGDIDIAAANVLLADGARLSTNAFGGGTAGGISISVGESSLPAIESVSIDGAALTSNLGTNVEGRAGNIDVRAATISLANGAEISTNTFGTGDAGMVQLEATDSLNILGEGTIVTSDVEPGAIGNGGDIDIAATNVFLAGGALLGTNAFGRGNAGSITISTEDSSLAAIESIAIDGAVLTSNLGPDVEGMAGNIDIRAATIALTNGAELSTNTFGTGDAGMVQLEATGSLNILGEGTIVTSDVEPEAIGNGGDIDVAATNVLLRGGALLGTNAFGEGTAGDISISIEESSLTAIENVSIDGATLSSNLGEGVAGSAGSIDVRSTTIALTDGAELSTNTFGVGDAGSITLEASDRIEISGANTTLVSDVEASAAGDGGSILAIAPLIQLDDAAEVSTDLLGTGQAGNLTLDADTIEILNGSTLSSVAAAGSTGNGGSIELRGRSLVLDDGSTLDTTASGNGSAGTIEVTVSETVSLDDNSQIFSSLESGATGSGGNIIISGDMLFVLNGSFLEASSAGDGAAGNIELNANTIRLDGGAALRAETVGGLGNIEIVSEDVRLRRGSNITTNATGTATGGNISISSTLLTGIENSDITANAQASFGGFVQITAEVVSGLRLSNVLTPASDITASSQLGAAFSGTIELSTPEVDPGAALVEPPRLVDVSGLLADDPCAVGQTSSFTIAGRGGLPPNPKDSFTSQTDSLEWARSPQEADIGEVSPSGDRAALPDGEIVEAAGWHADAEGNVLLVASPESMRLQQGVTSSQCSDR